MCRHPASSKTTRVCKTVKKSDSMINGLIQRSTSLLMIHQLIIQEIAVTAKRGDTNALGNDLSIIEDEMGDNVVPLPVKGYRVITELIHVPHHRTSLLIALNTTLSSRSDGLSTPSILIYS